MSYLTPNLNLLGISIGTDSGLTIEQNYNSNVNILDQHNHTPGNGTQIVPSGLNLNADVTFQNNQAINLKAAVFQQQPSLGTLNALYVGPDGNLYYNDGAGDPAIKITSGGNVNATASGIASGTATASFVSNVLVVNTAPNTPANIQGASILLGNNSLGSNYLTLSPPGSMVASYSLTLPGIPGVQSIMALDTAGNISAPYTVDAATIVIASNVIKVGNAGIQNANMATDSVSTGNLINGAVTGPKIGLAGPVISSGCGLYSAVGNSWHTVTNLSVVITTTGRPVMLQLQGVASIGTRNGEIDSNSDSLTQQGFFRNGAIVSCFTLGYASSLYNYGTDFIPVGCYTAIDIVGAGTYTYTFQVNPALGYINVYNCQLVAVEI